MDVKAGGSLPKNGVFAISDVENLAQQLPGSLSFSIVKELESRAQAMNFDPDFGNTLNLVVGQETPMCFILVGVRGMKGEMGEFLHLGQRVGGLLKSIYLDELTLDVVKNTEDGVLEPIDKAMYFLWGCYNELFTICEDKKGGYKDKIPAMFRLEGLQAKGVDLLRERTSELWGVVEKAYNSIQEPSNKLTPEIFMNRAKESLSDTSASVEVLDHERLAKEGLNLLSAVGSASAHKPLLGVCSWKPSGCDRPPIVLVGKGITMDCGGVCLKDRKSMYLMKKDMGGAAVVFSLFEWLVKNKLQRSVIAIFPLAENAVSSTAFVPGSIWKSHSGQHVSISNTDAEGRLILADAISYAESEFSPQEIITIATLTGAAMVSFGRHYLPFYTEDKDQENGVLTAADATGALVCSMPFSSYESVRSEHADVKTGFPAKAMQMNGSGVAARMLSHFVQKTPWAHMDIAGSVFLGDRCEMAGLLLLWMEYLRRRV